MNTTYDPYCGPAPLPADLWSSWNVDPLLLAVFAAIALLCLVSSWQGRARLASPLALAGWAVLILAFASPICALATALFSARLFHHVLLVAFAAPLLALAFPARPGLLRVPLSALFLAHTVLMWVWHAPAPYAFALSSHAAYWLMEGTLFVSAFLMWQAILAPGRAGTALGALLGSIVQMGMLGALLTFAARPLFEPHATTTLPYGLTPLADQQLAGLLLWVPAALPYLVAALFIAHGEFERMRRPAPGGLGRRP